MLSGTVSRRTIRTAKAASAVPIVGGPENPCHGTDNAKNGKLGR
jgi:hypothetical protein